MERRYHTTVLILWPEKNAFNMIMDLKTKHAFSQMLNLLKSGKWNNHKQ